MTFFYFCCIIELVQSYKEQTFIMLFRLDAESGVPFHQQIFEQVRRQAASGAVQAGDRLPTVRELAAELLVNPNTVARAYQDLERAGVVETRRGQGTFACAPGSKLDSDEKRRIVRALLDRARLEAVSLGLSAEEVGELVDSVFGGQP